ncbi:hypothetical protein OsJ_06428 [Oryza sativa Japonica Group]|uniref:Uncharacterized protein n=1 Tax=Oryza sativa subsp. japonica TaxID=39947 RepID=B9F596_ORYSJ|nr:hypothetical protein OsJ_06428 [Oryza sativa Japonica Group]
MATRRAPPPAAAAAADGSIEENAMAILDTAGIKDARDLHDDRCAFLETVRSACLAADSPSPPSWRMYNAVFQILQDSSSLELTMASLHLLMELGKQYPRAYLTDSGSGQALVAVKEAWSPFHLRSDVGCGEIGGNNRHLDHLFDSSRFSSLIEDMVETANDTDANNGIEHIKNMVLLEYLVSTLEADFVPRQIAYKESLDWVIFRESLLQMLLGVEDGISSKEGSAKSAPDLESSLAIISFEFERKALASVQKLFTMVMNLDLIRKEADTMGLTSRADGCRNPILDVILDELTYNISYLSPFLLIFVEWKWKLEIILQYFSKYCGKPAVRTRRSDNSQHDLTLENVLTLFSTAATTKAIVKKMSSEVVQLLLANAYQVCLHLECDSSKDSDTTKKIGATLLQISESFVSAFHNMRKINPDMQLSPFEKEALFTAASMARVLKNKQR